MLNSLVEMLMRSPGCTLNLTSLSKDFGVHKFTLQEHLFYLEFAKLIRVVKNFRPSVRAESRKLKKSSPGNISLTFPSPRGLWAPSTIGRKGYAEVDFIRKMTSSFPSRSGAATRSRGSPVS
jgi:hypothetical protein